MLNLNINPYEPSGSDSLLPICPRHPEMAGRAARWWPLGFIVLLGAGCEQALPMPKQEHVLRGGSWPIAFAPDGERLLTRSQADLGMVKAWDPRTGQELAEFSGPTINYPLVRVWTGGIASKRLRIGGFVLSPKGTLAASGTVDPLAPPTEEQPHFGRQLFLWDSTTGKEVRSVPMRSLAGPIVFSPDGKLVAVTDGEENVKLVDVQTGKVLPSPQFPFPTPLGIDAFAFSPDSKRLACANFISEDTYGAVSVWDIASGERIWEWGEASIGHRTIAFSPDGSLLASAGYGGDIHVRDARDGKHGYNLTSHQEDVAKIAFHPNGRYLASTGDDATRIWDLRARKVIRTLDHAPRPGADVAFSPDGKWLATACAGGFDGDGEPFVIVWNMQPVKGTK